MTREPETYGSTNGLLDLSRRNVLESIGGLGVASALSGRVAGDGTPSGGGPPTGDGGGGDDDDPDDLVASVTLITGETVRITERNGRRHYAVSADDQGNYQQFHDGGDTYVVPVDAQTDKFSQELFNIDYLIEQEVTDQETDGIPVVATTTGGGHRSPADAVPSSPGVETHRSFELIDAVAGRVRKEEASGAAQALQDAPAVDTVYLDALVTASLDESADAVDAPEARRQFGVDGAGVSIAVLDTGIDADHPDFGDRVVHRKDFSGDGPGDVAGHGTHVAGIAAGDGTVSDGKYVGMAPGADLWSVKVLANDGRGRLSWVIEGIDHAVDEGADVINMSLGSSSAPEDGPLQQAANAAVEQGTVLVAASGNEGGYSAIGTPAMAEKVLAVGASWGKKIPRFSSVGPTPHEYRVKPEIVAPGVYIMAAGSEDAGAYPYQELIGTSMASPHVAGIVALLLEHDPDLSPQDVRKDLVSTADDLPEAPNHYTQGAGRVDPVEALETDLRVHDPVVNFGLLAGRNTETATVTVENTGSEPISASVDVGMRNIQNEEDVSDLVNVSPGSIEVDPGKRTSVELTVETGAIGFNAGAIDFETDSGRTYRSIFGYTRGMGVTVEKAAHERSGGIEDDPLFAFSHDGETSHLQIWAFDAEGTYEFLLFGSPGEYTFWSTGALEPEPGQNGRVPVMTVTTAEIAGAENHVTLNERETVPRVLDTDPVSHHEPFNMVKFSPTLHAAPGGNLRVASPTFSVRTVHVTPIGEDNITTVSTEYLMHPEEMGGEHPASSPVMYHFLYGSVSLSGPRDVVEVDPAGLATERFNFHRTEEGQLLGVNPTVLSLDQENFPFRVSPFGNFFDVGRELTEQTWIRNQGNAYLGSFQHGSGFFGGLEMARAGPFIPEAGRTYHREYNREPLGENLTTWSFENGELRIGGNWSATQTDYPFVPDVFSFNDKDRYEVAVDGQVVDDGENSGFSALSTSVSGVDPGSRVTLTMEGNALGTTSRGTTTHTEYEATVGDAGPDTPPRVDTIEVGGLDEVNRVESSQAAVVVDLDHEADDVDSLQAYYARSGTVDAPPFEAADGWTEASILRRDGESFGVLVDVTDYDGHLDLAIRATDRAGGEVRTWTTEAIEFVPGGQQSLSVDVVGNVRRDPVRNVRVELRLDGAIDPSEIDTGSLRFGRPQTVLHGEGFSPASTEILDDGVLSIEYAAEDVAFHERYGGLMPVLVAGELSDGTSAVGADVVELAPLEDSRRDRNRDELNDDEDDRRDEGRDDDESGLSDDEDGDGGSRDTGGDSSDSDGRRDSGRGDGGDSGSDDSDDRRDRGRGDGDGSGGDRGDSSGSGDSRGDGGRSDDSNDGGRDGGR